MAHNVPDSFTGMYVKVKYGDETKRTQTVNAKATPKWTNDHLDSPDLDRNDTYEGNHFETKENDLEVHVPPLKTVGSLRLSVVGVRANTKVEIGVVYIPLTNAIEATYHNIHRTKSSRRMYVRWSTQKSEGLHSTRTRPRLKFQFRTRKNGSQSIFSFLYPVDKDGYLVVSERKFSLRLW